MTTLLYVLAWICITTAIVMVFVRFVHPPTKEDDDEQWEYFNSKRRSK